MKKLSITTKKGKGIVDITDRINELLTKTHIKKGFCHLFLPHSTAGLTTAYLSPQSELDLIDAFDVMIPHFTQPRQKYEHSHIVGHLPDHIIASFLGASLAIPIQNGQLLLGNYQRVVVVELNGPKKRKVLISFD